MGDPEELADQDTTQVVFHPKPERYHLETRLAVGGMGELIVGYVDGELGFRKRVVIKRMLQHDPEHLKLFRDEVRVASRLNHPNIVQVYDVVDIDGQFGLIMEHIDGVSLGDAIEARKEMGQPFDTDLAAFIAAEVATGLHHAHMLTDELDRPFNIVHRDVTPSNIMLSIHGEVKLIDFGIAKHKGAMSVTQVGYRRGRVAYMAPEYVAGQALNPKVDIYGLGTVLSEMLTLQRCMTETKQDKAIEAVMDGKIKTARDLRPELPEELLAIVDTMVALEADERHADAGESNLALRAFLARHCDPAKGHLRGLLGECVQQVTEHQGAPTGQAVIPKTAPVPHAIDDEDTESDDRGPSDPESFEHSQTRQDLQVTKAMLEQMQAEATGPNAPAVPPADTSPTVRDTAPVPRELQILRAMPTDIIGSRQPNPEVLQAEKEERGGRWRVAFFALLIFVVLAGGGVFAIQQMGLSRRTPETAVAAVATPNADDAPANAEDLPLEPVDKQPEDNEEVKGEDPPPFKALPSDAEPLASGSLQLSTEPILEVYWGNTHLGSTPLQSQELPAGQHELSLRSRKLGINKTINVNVEEGETTRRTVTLEQGSVTVIAPEGLKLFVGRRSVGVSPLSAPLELYEGVYRVRAADPAREIRMVRRVRVVAGEEAEVVFDDLPESSDGSP